jgi:hypothetical protein
MSQKLAIIILRFAIAETRFREENSTNKQAQEFVKKARKTRVKIKFHSFENEEEEEFENEEEGRWQEEQQRVSELESLLLFSSSSSVDDDAHLFLFKVWSEQIVGQPPRILTDLFEDDLFKLLLLTALPTNWEEHSVFLSEQQQEQVDVDEEEDEVDVSFTSARTSSFEARERSSQSRYCSVFGVPENWTRTITGIFYERYKKKIFLITFWFFVKEKNERLNFQNDMNYKFENETKIRSKTKSTTKQN